MKNRSTYPCERPNLHERKLVSSSSGMHCNSQIERYMDSSLPRMNHKEADYDIRRRKPSCTTFCKKNCRLNITNFFVIDIHNIISKIAPWNIHVERISVFSTSLPREDTFFL